MSRMLILLGLLVLLTPAVVTATEASFAIRLVIRAPVRVETPAGGGVAGTGAGMAGVEGASRTGGAADGRRTLTVDGPERSTVFILPPTPTLLDLGPAAGYEIVTILMQ